MKEYRGKQKKEDSQVFLFAPRHVTHQVAMQLQAWCNYNVRMNTFYTLKPNSNIYWNNLEIIALTVKLRAWIKVSQYHWHNCKEKISEKWRNTRENWKRKILRYFSFAPRHVTYQVAMQLQAWCNCNVRMNTFYTWKLYSNIIEIIWKLLCLQWRYGHGTR